MISEKNIGDSVIIEMQTSSKEIKTIKGFIIKTSLTNSVNEVLYALISIDQKQLFTSSFKNFENFNYRIVLFEKTRQIKL
jgi:hypothetical protein